MPINAQKMEELKQALLAEKTKLEGDLARIAVSPDKKDDFSPMIENIGTDREDNTTEVEQFTDNLPVEMTLEKKLQDIISALEKIEKGTYGICENCQEKIDIKRLEINPSAKTCIKC